MVNEDLLKSLDGPNEYEDDQIYVFAQHMKPGKRTFVASMPKGRRRAGEKQHFIHNIIVPNREEDVPVFEKLTKRSAKERQFTKPTSEYRDWREDSEGDAVKCIEHDIERWNCDRFVKDPDQLKLLEVEVKKHAEAIKNIFIQEASKSAFPQIGLLDFSHFAQQTKMIDQNLFSGVIDTYFIAATLNSVAADIPGLDGKLLMRHNFLELLVRVAKGKYLDPGHAETVHEAFSMLMKETILPNYVWEPWEDFRVQQLWTLECDDVFVANHLGLTKLQKSYWAPRKKFMNKEAAIRLFTQ